MISLPNRNGLPVALASLAFSMTLGACAAPRGGEAVDGGAVDARVLVKLVRPTADAAAVSAAARERAGVPLSYGAAVSPTWHALVLHCASAAQCEAAVLRLRAATALYEAVEIEGRKTRQAS